MATGSSGGLNPRQQERIEHALETCRRENGLDASILVGDLDLADLGGFRAAAERLHAALGDGRAAGALLMVVAPGQRRVEIVTGPAVRRRVPDRVCALAVLSMTSAFTGGDLAGGIVDALRQIADAAGRRAISPAERASADLALREPSSSGATGGTAHGSAAADGIGGPSADGHHTGGAGAATGGTGARSGSTRV